MSIRPTTKHDIQRDEENITRQNFSVITRVFVSGTMIVPSYSGIDVGSGDAYLYTKILVPFGVFTDVAPFTATPKLPYAATIDRTMTLTTWVQGCRVAGTSDASNYWTIELTREKAGVVTVIATIDTKTVNSTDWKNITATLSNYFITSGNTTILYITVATKVGAPGNLYLAGPALEAYL